MPAWEPSNGAARPCLRRPESSAPAWGQFAKALDGHKLLLLFGLLLVAVGLVMFRKEGGTNDANVRLTTDTARDSCRCCSVEGFRFAFCRDSSGLAAVFLVVLGAMLTTRMPLSSAIGTSLVAVSAFGAATAPSCAISGLTDQRVAALCPGRRCWRRRWRRSRTMLTQRNRALTLVFATAVVAVGVYVLSRGDVTHGSA